MTYQRTNQKDQQKAQAVWVQCDDKATQMSTEECVVPGIEQRVGPDRCSRWTYLTRPSTRATKDQISCEIVIISIFQEKAARHLD